MSELVARSPGGATARLLVAAWIAGAVALGALGAFLAGRVDPLALPALLVLGSVALASFARPLVGVAAAFPLLVVGHVGVTPGPPWMLGAAWAFVLVVVALVVSGGDRHATRLPPLTALLALFFAIAAVAAAVAGDIGDATPVLRTLVTGFALFFATATLVRRRGDLLWPLAGAAVAATMVSLYAAYQWRFGDPLGVGFVTDTGALVHRVSAGFGHPNQLGGFLVIIAPYVLAAGLLLRRARPLLLVVFALLVFGIYVSFSRGALIALATIPFLFLRGRHVLLLAPLLAGLVLAFAPGLLRERFGTLSAQGSELSSRVDMWTTAWQIWLANPVVGVGPGGFPDAYAVARVPGKQFLPATMFEAPPHAHNVVLQVLSELGLVGLIAFASILGVAAHLALGLRRRREHELRLVGTATVASIVAFMIHNQFDVTLLETNGIFFWALLGLVAAAAGVAASDESARTVDAVGRGLAPPPRSAEHEPAHDHVHSELLPAAPAARDEHAPPAAVTLDEIERLVAARAEIEPERLEEWRHYLLLLDEYADEDGRLPEEFGPLLHEVFGELLRRR